MSKELLKLLKDKKVADSYQYYVTSENKLYFAEVSLKALENIIKTYQNDEEQRVQQVYADAFKTGIGKFIAHNHTVDYFGTEMNVTAVMDKLTMEIMSLLHNFFDTFAQWLNSALLGEKALPIKNATLFNLVKEIKKFPEYLGIFVNSLDSLSNSPEYLYIADFNNILKHRYQIYIDNIFDIINAKGNVSIPSFAKDGRVHVKEDAIDKLTKSLEFCRKLFDQSTDFVKQYYATNDCKYTTHRVYNPKTFLLYSSREDYEANRVPNTKYHYIDIDATNIPDKFQIMLCYDSMDRLIGEERDIECYNSPYPIIMLRDKLTERIIGVLKPDDNEIYDLNDGHELKYRQYSSVTTDFEKEVAIALMNCDEFKVFPALSDQTIIVINS